LRASLRGEAFGVVLGEHHDGVVVAAVWQWCTGVKLIVTTPAMLGWCGTTTDTGADLLAASALEQPNATSTTAMKAARRCLCSTVICLLLGEDIPW
jgi:hypothetical protein